MVNRALFLVNRALVMVNRALLMVDRALFECIFGSVVLKASDGMRRSVCFSVCCSVLQRVAV